MNIKKLSDTLSVSSQIKPEHMKVLKAEGFQAIICNRPDGETADQPSFADIEAAAAIEKIEAVYIPINMGLLSQEQVDQFSRSIDALPHPILAYCRSGARSEKLWSFHIG